MVLVIQIALGILLGYLLIEHRSNVGRGAVIALQIALGLTFIGVVIWGAAEAIQWFTEISPGSPSRLSRIWSGLETLLGAILFLVLIIIGALGFYFLVAMTLSRWIRLPSSLGVIAALGFLNVLLLIPVELFLRKSPYGAWYRAADNWSRSPTHYVATIS